MNWTEVMVPGEGGASRLEGAADPSAAIRAPSRPLQCPKTAVDVP